MDNRKQRSVTTNGNVQCGWYMPLRSGRDVAGAVAFRWFWAVVETLWVRCKTTSICVMFRCFAYDSLRVKPDEKCRFLRAILGSKLWYFMYVIRVKNGIGRGYDEYWKIYVSRGTVWFSASVSRETKTAKNPLNSRLFACFLVDFGNLRPFTL